MLDLHQIAGEIVIPVQSPTQLAYDDPRMPVVKPRECDNVFLVVKRMLPVDDIQAAEIAQELLQKPPEVGYLTISNALQWRLQYKRVIEFAGEVDGLVRVR